MRLGSTASVFALLVSFGPLSCEEQSGQPERAQSELAAFPACPGPAEAAHIYRLDLMGRAAGWQRLELRSCGGDRREARAERHLAFKRAGARVELFERHQAMLDAHGALLRLRYERGQSGAGQTQLEAGRVGDQMLVLSGPETLRMPFEPRAADAEFFFLALDDVHPGQRHSFRAFCPATGRYADDRAVVRAGEAGRVEIEHRSAARPGTVEVVSWTAGAYLPAAARYRQGRLSIEAVEVAALPPPPADEDLPDLSELMRVPTRGRVPDKLVRARYRMRHAPDYLDAAQLSGPFQRARAQAAAGEWEIEVGPRCEPAASKPEPRFLEPTAMAQSGSREIAMLAAELAPQSTPPALAAGRLRDWVAAEIEPDMGLSFATALEVLERRKGDCSEKATLLVALARAAGIPARAVGGLVYHRRAFAGHMWAELWIPGEGWALFDPSLGQTPIAARIRLGEVPLELGRPASALAAMTSGIEVEVLQAEAGNGMVLEKGESR